METEYIVIVNCEDDLEKKRVDYVIEKWKSLGAITKVKGFVLKVRNLDEDLITEIYSKLVKGNIEIYKLHPIREVPEISKSKRRMTAYFNKDIEEVDKLITFIFSKINSVSEKILTLNNTIERGYSVYVRGKGKVDVEIKLKAEENIVITEFMVEGSEDAVNSFIVNLARDLKFFDAKVEL